MTWNSGRHAQPDPQSCRVRSLGGRGREPKNKQRIKRPKQISSANANTEKASASNVAAESALHPRHVAKACDNNPNNSKQHDALAKTGDMQAGLETFNQQPCSPESCHSVTLAKVLLFGKAAPFFAKKVTASNLIFGAINTLAVRTPKSGPLQ